MRQISYSKSIKSCLVGGTAGYMQWHSRIYGGGGLFDYSVKPGPDFVKVKVRFGQVGDEVGQGQVCPFGDQVGQGQGQELDNNLGQKFKYHIC